MKRYLNLFSSLVRFATKSDLEYRANAIGNFIYSLLSVLTSLFFINIFFSSVHSLNNWSKYEAFLLIGVFRVLLAVQAILFRGIFMLPAYINKGELDLLLVKPMDSQFFISLRFPRIMAFLDALPGIFITIFAILNMNIKVNPLSILILTTSLLFGSIIFYSIMFIIATFSIWLKGFYSLPDLFYIIREPLGIPIDILGKTTSFVLTFVFPLAFIITVPVKVFLGKDSIFYFFGNGLIAILLFYFSVWFWRFSLKHYTSASS